MVAVTSSLHISVARHRKVAPVLVTAVWGGGAEDSVSSSHVGIRVWSPGASRFSARGLQSHWRRRGWGRGHMGDFDGPGLEVENITSAQVLLSRTSS